MRWGAGASGRSDHGIERFETGGRTFGYVGVLLAAGLVVLWLTRVGADRPMPVPVLTGALLAGILCWAAILRPRVSASPDTLVLRNMLETVHIPLAAIEDHVLRQVLAVRAGRRRYVASGVGRSLRSLGVSARPGRTTEPSRLTGGAINAADFVEARIRDLALDARDRAGVERYSQEQVALAQGVCRTPAWPVIAALVIALVLFVGSLLLS